MDVAQDAQGDLTFLKIKMGVVALDAPRREIDEKEYFLVDASVSDLPHIKETVAAFNRVKDDKKLKASLVVFDEEKKFAETLEAYHEEGRVAYVSGIRKDDKRLLLHGALAHIILDTNGEFADIVHELLRNSSILVVPNNDEMVRLTQHAAYFLERVSEQEIGSALLKLENSSSLRESIQRSAQDAFSQDAESIE